MIPGEWAWSAEHQEKTIEAGLIMRELKLRGLVRRTLVVAPKGLVTQWLSELRLHFNEEFRLVLPEDLKTLARLTGGRIFPSHDPVFWAAAIKAPDAYR